MSWHAETGRRYGNHPLSVSNKRRAGSDLLWSHGTALAGLIGVAGWVTLIGDVVVWLTTGAWPTETLGNVLIGSGHDAPSSAVLRFVSNIPIGLCLVLAAPGVFSGAIKAADWLDGG